MSGIEQSARCRRAGRAEAGQSAQTMQKHYILVQSPAGQARVDLDESPLTIGRHADNRLVLHDNRASRAHCIIELAGDGYRVRDLNSSNGTFLNGNRAATNTLKPGDVITIGAVQMLLQVDAPEPVGEILSLDDVVEDEPVTVADRERIDLRSASGDHEESLEHISQALPPSPFGEHEIALANARGRVIHEASAAARRHGSRRDIIGLIRLALLVAFQSRSTDIHLEPRRDTYNLRVRLDGLMVDAAQFPHQIGVKLASAIKVIAEIDLAQRDAIQEGSFSALVPDARSRDGFRRVDYRCSFAPSVFGQKLVMRVLDVANAPLKIQNLGLPAPIASAVADALSQEAGMILVAGPTGSGKTTTLYALLRSIDVEQRNVVTIEDPVEIQLDGVTQMQVDEAQDRTFHALLRSILLQDPDVILIGEVRDSETARVAMQAAITGHLVFSTVHTKDTAGAIFRLLDLGVEPYMIGQGLHMVIAQRLVRTLCNHCKRSIAPTAAHRKILGEKHAHVQRVFEPVGCTKCLGTGFFGRRAVCELLVSSEHLKQVIVRNPSLAEVRATIDQSGFLTLLDTGIDLAAKGFVSLTEVERAIGK
jgi:general secretion pathway protein E